MGGVSTKNNVPMGDFPNPHKFASIMKNFEMWKFPALKPQEIQALDEVLSRGVPKLLEQVEEKRNLQNEQENDPFLMKGMTQIHLMKCNWAKLSGLCRKQRNKNMIRNSIRCRLLMAKHLAVRLNKL